VGAQDLKETKVQKTLIFNLCGKESMVGNVVFNTWIQILVCGKF
jgi:hypothetical protein